MEEYPTPSKKSVVKMVRITQSPRNHEDSSAMESSDAISKVNDCNGYNHLLKPIEGNGQHRKSTACWLPVFNLLCVKSMWHTCNTYFYWLKCTIENTTIYNLDLCHCMLLNQEETVWFPPKVSSLNHAQNLAIICRKLSVNTTLKINTKRPCKEFKMVKM